MYIIWYFEEEFNSDKQKQTGKSIIQVSNQKLDRVVTSIDSVVIRIFSKFCV